MKPTNSVLLFGDKIKGFDYGELFYSISVWLTAKIAELESLKANTRGSSFSESPAQNHAEFLVFE